MENKYLQAVAQLGRDPRPGEETAYKNGMEVVGYIDSVPVIKTYRSGNTVVFFCAYCEMWHKHTPQQVYSSGKCSYFKSPLLKTGYYLVNSTKY